MKPILTICPSRERPERLKEMIESFIKTSSQSDLVVVLDEDDPCMDKYERIVSNEMLDNSCGSGSSSFCGCRS